MVMDELFIEPSAVTDELTTFIRRTVEDFRRGGAIVGLLRHRPSRGRRLLAKER